MKIKKSDKVIVITGKDKGKTGVVVETNVEKNQVVVEGVNVRTVHRKPTQQNPEGGVFQVEKPINVSNVMLLEGKGKAAVATKIGYRYEKNEKTGKTKKVRYAKKTNTEI